MAAGCMKAYMRLVHGGFLRMKLARLDTKVKVCTRTVANKALTVDLAEHKTQRRDSFKMKKTECIKDRTHVPNGGGGNTCIYIQNMEICCFICIDKH
jgi:hypothetical protein